MFIFYLYCRYYFLRPILQKKKRLLILKKNNYRGGERFKKILNGRYVNKV